MHDDDFRQLLKYFHLSWTGYRKVRKGVKKRIRRHMMQLGCGHIEAYLGAIHSNETARNECQCRMTVSISRFFRDRSLWECLKSDVLPALVDTGVGELHAWSAGCARGEEVYSLKILWDMLYGCRETAPFLNILASDVNENYLEKARTGIFERSGLKEIPVRHIGKYFIPRGGQWMVKDNCKKDIQWEKRDLLTGLPRREFDLVFVRNSLLTYYDDTFRIPVFKKLIQRLRPGGFLAIGSHEKFSGEENNLFPMPCHPSLFLKSDP